MRSARDHPAAGTGVGRVSDRGESLMGGNQEMKKLRNGKIGF